MLYLCHELFILQELSTEVSVLINRKSVCSRIVMNSVFSFGLNAVTTVTDYAYSSQEIANYFFSYDSV